MLDRDGEVMAAGGWFVQAMPGCSEEVLATLEKTC
jgi:redox-regulated HSP33 family molecular chaperone